MPKLRQGAILTTLSFKEGEGPLHRRLYLRIRELILEGRLAPKSRLPSSRTLAAELGVSRSTVLNAVDQLVAEEYLEARVGDGTYVTACRRRDEAPLGRAPTGSDKESNEVPPTFEEVLAEEVPPTLQNRSLSRRGEAVFRSPLGGDPACPRPFNVGVPDFNVFPHSLWQRLFSRHLKALDGATMSYGDPAGYRPLREALARYVTTARGVRCTADQVLIVSSSQQALDLAARVLLNPGDGAWIEDPGYLGARGALLAAGARLTPVPVDVQGLDLEAGIGSAPNARLVYITPSHQYPTGAVLSLERRLALLEWAAYRGAWIVEDDYDSEFRYTGRPLASLQGLDPEGRVIYVGTFTKVLYPSLRLAYLVVPPDLFAPFLAARSFIDRHPPTLPQAVVADFLDGGHFNSHLRKMRALYAHRQAVFLNALGEATARTGLPLEAAADPAGMHLVLELPAGLNDVQVARRAREAGIATTPLSRYCLGPCNRPSALLLGYTGFDEDALERGVTDLVTVLTDSRLNPHPRS